MKVPKVGDYLRFDKEFSLLDMHNVIEKDDLVKIMQICYGESHNHWTERLECTLYVAAELRNANNVKKLYFLRISYNIIQDFTTILPDGPATMLLFKKN